MGGRHNGQLFPGRREAVRPAVHAARALLAMAARARRAAVRGRVTSQTFSAAVLSHVPTPPPSSAAVMPA